MGQHQAQSDLRMVQHFQSDGRKPVQLNIVLHWLGEFGLGDFSLLGSALLLLLLLAGFIARQIAFVDFDLTALGDGNKYRATFALGGLYCRLRAR